jgi:hypothetical protein
LKDIELARHALQNIKAVDVLMKEMECTKSEEVQHEEVPLLEWLDDDEENEQYTLVQSRKKRKRKFLELIWNFQLGRPLSGEVVEQPLLYIREGRSRNILLLGKKSKRRK